MAEEYTKCLVCSNEIVPSRGLKGSEGIDEHNEPKPFWSEDPLLTPQGLAGDDFRGKNPARWLHIKELQDYYAYIEDYIGLEEKPEEPEEGKTYKTEFLEVGWKEPIRRMHIVQLRQSVEKILSNIGSSLTDYFKYDRYGNVTSSSQTEWTDIDRSEEVPNLSKGTPIKAIHIEELRIGLLLYLWIETWPDNPLIIDDEKTVTDVSGYRILRKYSYEGDLGRWASGTLYGQAWVLKDFYGWLLGDNQLLRESHASTDVISGKLRMTGESVGHVIYAFYLGEYRYYYSCHGFSQSFYVDYPAHLIKPGYKLGLDINIAEFIPGRILDDRGDIKKASFLHVSVTAVGDKSTEIIWMDKPFPNEPPSRYFYDPVSGHFEVPLDILEKQVRKLIITVSVQPLFGYAEYPGPDPKIELINNGYLDVTFDNVGIYK